MPCSGSILAFILHIHFPEFSWTNENNARSDDQITRGAYRMFQNAPGNGMRSKNEGGEKMETSEPVHQRTTHIGLYCVRSQIKEKSNVHGMEWPRERDSSCLSLFYEWSVTEFYQRLSLPSCKFNRRPWQEKNGLNRSAVATHSYFLLLSRGTDNDRATCHQLRCGLLKFSKAITWRSTWWIWQCPIQCP